MNAHRRNYTPERVQGWIIGVACAIAMACVGVLILMHCLRVDFQ